MEMEQGVCDVGVACDVGAGLVLPGVWFSVLVLCAVCAWCAGPVIRAVQGLLVAVWSAFRALGALAGRWVQGVCGALRGVGAAVSQVIGVVLSFGVCS